MQSPTNKQRFNLKSLFNWQANPKPIDPPTIDPNLENLDALTRSAESIRYSILSVEFWISADGQVRRWLRNHARLAAVLAIPAFLILPLVTFILWQLVIWIGMLVSLAGQLIVFPILALLAALIVWIVIEIFKALFRAK